MRISKIILIISAIALASIGLVLFYMHRASPYINTITQIDSFTQAADILNAADKNTLVLFDVDDTLIEPASVIFRPKTGENEAYRPWLIELTSRALWKCKKLDNYYVSIWRSQENFILIEPEIATTIQSLQERGIKVLALTSNILYF